MMRHLFDYYLLTFLFNVSSRWMFAIIWGRSLHVLVGQLIRYLDSAQIVLFAGIRVRRGCGMRPLCPDIVSKKRLPKTLQCHLQWPCRKYSTSLRMSPLAFWLHVLIRVTGAHLEIACRGLYDVNFTRRLAADFTANPVSASISQIVARNGTLNKRITDIF
jgi:hypothetical protein